MSRNSKITSSGPNSSSTFLKNSKWELKADPRFGRSTDIDIVDFKNAKKACEKAKNEGKIEALNEALSLIRQHQFWADNDTAAIYQYKYERSLKNLIDKTLGQKV